MVFFLISGVGVGVGIAMIPFFRIEACGVGIGALGMEDKGGESILKWNARVHLPQMTWKDW